MSRPFAKLLVFLCACAFAAPSFPIACLESVAYWSTTEEDATNSVAWGDYDNDGDLDFAVGNTGTTPDTGAPNRVYRNIGEPGKFELVWSSTEEDRTVSVAWADWDKDGDLDLAVGNTAEDGAQARVYQNNGGAFVLAWTSTEISHTYAVAWGDYDKDGYPDLAVANFGTIQNLTGEVNRVYKNTHGGLALAWTSAEADLSTSVAWGDYDGDGDLDLAFGGIGLFGGRNRVYRNNSTPTVTAFALAWTSGPATLSTSVAWGDADKDGDFDLAVGNIGANHIFKNNAGTLQTTPAWTSIEEDSTTAVAWADWDKDGDPDLAAANSGANCLVYDNRGAFSFVSAWTNYETFGPTSIAWGDWDKNGWIDLLVGNSDGPNNLYINECGDPVIADFTGSPTSGAPPLSVLFRDSSVGATQYRWDFGDSSPPNVQKNPQHWYTVPGIYSVNLTASTPGVGTDDLLRPDYINVSRRCLDLVEDWTSQENFLGSSLAWADVDRDGDPDLVVGDLFGNTRLYRNDNGALTSVWTDPGSDGTAGVAWGDWDNDGDPDLAVGNIGDPNRVYRNDNGTLALAWSAPITEQTQSVAWADWDGDGDLDLAVGNTGEETNTGAPNRVYRNDGGTLTSAWTSSESDQTTSVAWADWDLDGDPDLAVANTAQTGAPIRVYKNNGGNLVLAWSSPTLVHGASLAWGDLDGDGYPDLAVGITGASAPGGATLVYRNTGGSLTLHWTSPLLAYNQCVAWGDWDGDFDLDLAVGSAGDYARVFANTGGVLALAWSSLAKQSVAAVAFGDIDGDWAQELAVASYAYKPIRIYTGNCPLTPLRTYAPYVRSHL